MARARPRRSPVVFHATPTSTGALAALPTLFPAAVAGEQYERYAKSVWAQANRWLTSHWADAAATPATALDVRQKLRSVAAADVKRHLYAQEEQLLSEIVHAAWNASSAFATESQQR
jgi:hypothetical protein